MKGWSQKEGLSLQNRECVFNVFISHQVEWDCGSIASLCCHSFIGFLKLGIFVGTLPPSNLYCYTCDQFKNMTSIC